MKPDNSTTQNNKWQYEYTLSDHLGNGRVSYTDTNSEFGVYDFGWRQYDASIGRWNRLDRFSEKYFTLSPYSHGANNPLKFKDVRGDSLWITHKKNKILYQDGKLYESDGKTEYRGKGVKVKKDGSIKLKGFLGKSVDALNTLSSEDTGNSIVDELQGSKENYTIIKGSGGNSYSPSTKTINFDPSSKKGGLNENGKRERPTFVGLGHEMAHAVDDDRGSLDFSQDPNFDNFRNAEKFATHIENQIRSEHGIDIRTHYGTNQDGTWIGKMEQNLAYGILVMYMVLEI